jgi:hypothetical protein
LDARTNYTITAVSELGEPKEPTKAAQKFIKQCGVLVRDHVPITVREWQKPKGAPTESEYVADRYKETLWNDLMTHFTLPEYEDDADTAALRSKVKAWALKKMGELFRQWKKRLWQDYKKKKEESEDGQVPAPAFEGYLAKQAHHWEEFLQYKESEEAKEKSKKNKTNADKKKYHHTLGPGGYKAAMPKWDKKEAELLAKGVEPEWVREDWELRARNWFLAHGGEYNEETGDLVCSDGIRVPRTKWLNTVKEIKEGKLKFRPDREKDLLTLVLENEEKGGRTRGLGPNFPWSLGFAKDIGTYRSRARAKKRLEEVEGDRFKQLLSRIDMQQQQIDELRGVVRLQDPALHITDGPTQRRSSVADSEAVPATDARMIDGGPGYPVDGIKDSTSCELHHKMKNISMKVAIGYAMPCPPDARWHCGEIPAGYAKVGVDEVVEGFHSLELDIPGAEGERTLGEVVGGIILWDKSNIKLPGSAPRTTPPPSRRRSPTPPPHDYDHHSASPSRSPPPDMGRPSSPPPLPAKRIRASMSSNRRSPKRKLSPLPKVPHANLPIRPYDRTDEENDAIAQAKIEAHFGKKKPDPPRYTPRSKKRMQEGF